MEVKDMPLKIEENYENRPKVIFAVARRYFNKSLQCTVISTPETSSQRGAAILRAARELHLFDGSTGWAITLYAAPESLSDFNEDFQVFARAMQAEVRIDPRWFLAVAAESRGDRFFSGEEYREEVEPLQYRLNRALQTIERHAAKAAKSSPTGEG